MAVEKRFLKYVSYWTTSEDDQESIPSTKRQFELAKVLEQELKELNLEKVKLDEHCYVYGLLPAITTGFVLDCRIRSIAAADSKCCPSPGPIPTAE